MSPTIASISSSLAAINSARLTGFAAFPQSRVCKRFNIFQGWRKNLGHRAIVAEQVNDEGLAQIVSDALVGEQVAHIEEIAGMLAVQRRDDLARIKVGEDTTAGLGKSEFRFDGRLDRCHVGFEDTAAQNGRHFDLDLNALGPNHKFDNGVFGHGFGDLGIR